MVRPIYLAKPEKAVTHEELWPSFLAQIAIGAPSTGASQIGEQRKPDRAPDFRLSEHSEFNASFQVIHLILIGLWSPCVPHKRQSIAEFLLMKRFLVLTAVVTPLALSAIPSQAIPQSQLPAVNASAEASLLTHVQYRRCGFWRRECAFRWPALGPRFRRCLAIHGCW